MTTWLVVAGSLLVMLLGLVFVSEHSGVVELDCVVGEDGTGRDATGRAPTGMPFTLEAQLPWSAAWAAGAVESVLRHWASDGSMIKMAVVDSGVGRSVQLS